VEIENPLDKYPLYDANALRRNADHVYTYLNTSYVFDNLTV
jgi:hypothetical protein